MRQLSFYILLVQLLAGAFSQRVAPGVPPQHYQQGQAQHQQVPVQHHQQHQVPVQQHQVPVQQHQVPVQQQHVPIQQQQQHVPIQQQQQHVPVQQQHVPVQQQHIPVQQQHVPDQPHVRHHGHMAQSGPILNAANIASEKAHIAEHLEVPMDTSKMSEQELQFHYFKMHDADNNNKLDGCELIKSLIHWHEQGSKDTHEGGGHANHVEEKVFSDEELIALIDPILAMDDASKDGFIDYPEFVRAQHKAANNVQKN